MLDIQDRESDAKNSFVGTVFDLRQCGNVSLLQPCFQFPSNKENTVQTTFPLDFVVVYPVLQPCLRPIQEWTSQSKPLLFLDLRHAIIAQVVIVRPEFFSILCPIALAVGAFPSYLDSFPVSSSGTDTCKHQSYEVMVQVVFA